MRLHAFREDRKRGDPPIERVFYTTIEEAEAAMERIQVVTGADVFIARIPLYYVEDVD